MHLWAIQMRDLILQNSTVVLTILLHLSTTASDILNFFFFTFSSLILNFQFCEDNFPWTNLDSIFKSRDITLPTKVHLVKAMEKEMATYSSILAWTIPGTEEPGGLPSMGWHRVRHDWSNLAAAAADRIKVNKQQIKYVRHW